jgi:hypothetical protein
MLLRENHLKILQKLYDEYSDGGDKRFIPLRDFEIDLPVSGNDLRALVEDLKAEGLCDEQPEGIRISFSGLHYARSTWG